VYGSNDEIHNLPPSRNTRLAAPTEIAIAFKDFFMVFSSKISCRIINGGLSPVVPPLNQTFFLYSFKRLSFTKVTRILAATCVIPLYGTLLP
jgi:hypothetical protein